MERRATSEERRARRQGAKKSRERRAGRQGAKSKERGAKSREQGAGSREQGAGSEERRAKREERARLVCRFEPLHCHHHLCVRWIELHRDPPHLTLLRLGWLIPKPQVARAALLLSVKDHIPQLLPRQVACARTVELDNQLVHLVVAREKRAVLDDALDQLLLGRLRPARAAKALRQR